MESLPDQTISLPIPVDIDDKWVPLYFQDVDVAKLTHDDIRKFLLFHVEQYKRKEEEQLSGNAHLSSTIETKEACLQMAKCYGELYLRYKGYLESDIITTRHLDKYKLVIQDIIQRYQPREIIQRHGDLPFKLNVNRVRDCFEDITGFTDGDIIDFLVREVTLDDEYCLTPPEKAQLEHDMDVIEKLTDTQLNKYRQLIIQIKVGKDIQPDDLVEYFITIQGHNRETLVITHAMYCEFLVWSGFDPEEIQMIEIHPCEIYGSLDQVINGLDNAPSSDEETSSDEE